MTWTEIPVRGRLHMADHLVVLVTVPSNEVGREIAITLLNERLCACVNILPALSSFYVWEGKVHSDEELLLVIKTTGARFQAMTARVHALHPYDVPEIIATPIVEGSQDYLAWIDEAVG